VLGSGVSPQATRQLLRSRSSARRHSLSRVQRANSVYSVPEGMPESWPMARHGMPQKHTPQRHWVSAAAMDVSAVKSWPKAAVKARKLPVEKGSMHQSNVPPLHNQSRFLLGVKA